MITIVDYQCGNLFSIQKALKRLGIKSITTNDPKALELADKIILPGVGSFNTGMRNLAKYKLINILSEKILIAKTPVLGICLGMQLFSKFSEEGNVEGLGYIDANVKKFKFDKPLQLKTPHVGWNNVSFLKENRLFENIDKSSQFYFVHSFHMVSGNQQNIYLSTSGYGYDFISAFSYDNIYGVQFHPEKSHDQGLQLIKNFNKV
jgi:imidazole glycerol-phosphate synthase subunit HisH